jgi:hypothetical protein
MKEKKTVVKIVNPTQAGFYADNGLEPIRIYRSYGRWVWEFGKEESNPLFTRWLNNENKLNY